MVPTPGFEAGPHWWEASALITAPSLAPLHTFFGFEGKFSTVSPRDVQPTFLYVEGALNFPVRRSTGKPNFIHTLFGFEGKFRTI